MPGMTEDVLRQNLDIHPFEIYFSILNPSVNLFLKNNRYFLPFSSRFPLGKGGTFVYTGCEADIAMYEEVLLCSK